MLVLDLPLGLKSRCINRLSFHSRVSRPDFTVIGETERRRRRKVEVLTRPTFVTILPRVSFLAGMSEATRVGACRRYKKTTLFSVSRHTRSLPFSRLARRESTACSSESNPWFEAATLPRYPCSWTTTTPPSRSLSFFSRVFCRLCQLATPYLFLSSFSFPFVSLVSLSEFYLNCLTACLALSSHSVFLLLSRLTLSSCS